MPWMKVALSSAETAESRADDLQNAFDATWKAMRCTDGAAMLVGVSRGEEDDIYYFSPAAVLFFRDALADYAAVECAAPSADQTSFLTGDDKAMSTLARA